MLHQWHSDALARVAAILALYSWKVLMPMVHVAARSFFDATLRSARFHQFDAVYHEGPPPGCTDARPSQKEAGKLFYLPGLQDGQWSRQELSFRHSPHCLATHSTLRRILRTRRGASHPPFATPLFLGRSWSCPRPRGSWSFRAFA